MPDNRHELIATLNSSLVSQRYSPVVVRNYCTYASGFLDGLEQRGIPVAEDVVGRIFEAAKKSDRVLFDSEILALAGKG